MDRDVASRFIERLGLMWERVAGVNRTMGRVLGWLMICDPPEQSAPDLVAALKISKANISTTVRSLETAHLIERVTIPGNRRIHYRVPGGGWDVVTKARMAELDRLIEVGRLGQAALADEPAERRERIDDWVEWMTWWRNHYERMLDMRAKERKK